MANSKLRKFINDHLFGLVLSALASLATAVGGWLLVAIKTDLNQLECRVAQFGAKNEYKSVQLKLIVTPLDDISRASEPYADLSSIISDFQSSLEKCPQGREDFKQLENYKRGLDSFIDRDWNRAIEYFRLIADRTALSEKSIANALLHKYIALKEMNDPKAGELQEQWRSRIDAAHQLAAREVEYTRKETALAQLSCSALLVDAPVQDAIDCLDGLVSKGQANYATYYNLAALNARRGDFETAARHMDQCFRLPGAMTQRRADIVGDPDFKKMLADAKYGAKLREYIGRLKL
jgi:hypothetical protein